MGLALGSSKSYAQFCAEPNVVTNPDNPSSGFSNQPANSFDWRTSSYDVFSQYQVNSVIESPFYHPNNADLDHLVESKDMKSEDGWELMAYKTGVKPDGTNSTTQADFVYVVLYNKYSSILRVMAAGDPIGNHNGAQISITFSGTGDYNPSNLSFTSGVKDVESLESDDLEASSVMKYREGSSKWFYADFPMAYDPCVCDFESKFVIGISLLDKATIDLSGNISGNISDVSSPTSGQVKENGYSFNKAVKDGTKAVKAYKTLTGFAEKQYKAWKIDTSNPATITQQKQVTLDKVNGFVKALNDDPMVKIISSAIPYMETALAVVDLFIAKKNEPSGPQQVKISPMAINAEVTLTGDIVAPYYFDDIIFATPGSKGAANNYTTAYNNTHPNPNVINGQYPLYNEPMGTVNLMKEPKMLYKRGLTSGFDQGRRRYYLNYFKLDLADLKLLLNPSADVSFDELYAQIEFEEQVYNSIVGMGPSMLKTELKRIDPTGSNLPLYRYSSRLIPLGCIGDFVAELSIIESLSLPLPKLKIYANLRPDDATNDSENALFVAKFPTNLVNMHSNTQINWNSAFNFPNTRTLTAGLSPITSDVRAWQSIRIESGTVFQPGPNGIKIVASEKIDIEAGVEIPAGVDLIIGDPTGCTQMKSPEGNTAIQNFCRSNAYKTNTRQARFRAPDDSPAVETVATSFHLITRPNPFTHNTQITYSLAEAGTIKISLYDMMGRKVMDLVQEEYQTKGAHELMLSGESLSPGTYTVVLEGQDGRVFKKIVKQ